MNSGVNPQSEAIGGIPGEHLKSPKPSSKGPAAPRATKIIVSISDLPYAPLPTPLK